MFDTKNWCKVISQTYNLKLVKFNLKKNNLLYAIEKKDNKNNTLVYFSPFGDYYENFKSISKIKLLSKKKSDIFYNYKFISKNRIKKKNCYLDGYVHLLNINNYNDWIYGKKIKYSFKRYLKEKYTKNIIIKFSYKKKDLDIFYSLYEKYRYFKFNKIAQPKSFFNNIFSTYIKKKNGFIVSAYNQKEILSSMIFICDYKNKKSYYKFGCSKLKNKFKSDNFIILKVIQYLIKKKIKQICFGYSQLDNYGLIRFKRSIGTDQYYRYNYKPKIFFENKKSHKLNLKIKKVNFDKLKNLKNEYFQFL